MSTTLRIALLWIITLSAAAFFAFVLVRATVFDPESSLYDPALAAQAPIAHASSSALPARLIIPSLNINAAVQDLGINAEGNMQAPDNFTDVGWYKYGTIPGQIGTALIDGHVDNGLGLDGVFKHLSSLRVGADVYVQQGDGSKIHFQVVQIQAYPYQSVPMAAILAENDAARLDLITCDGTWVDGQDTYNERLVIFTKLVSS